MSTSLTGSRLTIGSYYADEIAGRSNPSIDYSTLATTRWVNTNYGGSSSGGSEINVATTTSTSSAFSGASIGDMAIVCINSDFSSSVSFVSGRWSGFWGYAYSRTQWETGRNIFSATSLAAINNSGDGQSVYHNYIQVVRVS